MYIRRKLYSNIEGEKVPVEQTTLFSAKDDAKGAAKGAGLAAGTVGIGIAGAAGAGKAADFLKGRRAKAIEKAKAANGEASKNLMGKFGKEAEEARANFEKVQKKGVKIEAANREAGKVESVLGKVGSKFEKAKNWINNTEGKAQAVAEGSVSKSGAKLTGAAATAKTDKLTKAANKIARNRKIGVGLAAAGTVAAGAGIGAGIAHLKGKKAEEKTYSVLMTEEELALFSEIQKEFGDKIEGKNIRIGSKARIWADKHLQTKKDREAMIEAYDQEGHRNSHKLGKQAAKWATGGTALGLAGAGVAAAVSDPEEAKEVANRVGRVLKVATKNKKVAKAVAKDAAKLGGAVGALGAGVAGGAYLGTRGGRLIEKGIENISEGASHKAQKTADENKVASGKMSKEDFAKKYGKNVRLDSNK